MCRFLKVSDSFIDLLTIKPFQRFTRQYKNNKDTRDDNRRIHTATPSYATPQLRSPSSQAKQTKTTDSLHHHFIISFSSLQCNYWLLICL